MSTQGRDEMQTDTIKIEKNIPAPNNGVRGSPKYPFRKMEVGDSFLFPAGARLASSSRAAGDAGRMMGGKFACRTTPEGIRCWRIA